MELKWFLKSFLRNWALKTFWSQARSRRLGDYAESSADYRFTIIQGLWGLRNDEHDFWCSCCFCFRPYSTSDLQAWFRVCCDKETIDVSPSRHRRQFPRREAEVPLSYVSECLQSQDQPLLPFEIWMWPVAAIQLSLLCLSHETRVECACSRA